MKSAIKITASIDDIKKVEEIIAGCDTCSLMHDGSLKPFLGLFGQAQSYYSKLYEVYCDPILNKRRENDPDNWEYWLEWAFGDSPTAFIRFIYDNRDGVKHGRIEVKKGDMKNLKEFLPKFRVAVNILMKGG